MQLSLTGPSFTLPLRSPFDLSEKSWPLSGKVLKVETWAEYEFFHSYRGYLCFGFHMIDDESVRDDIFDIGKYRHTPVFVSGGLGLWYHGDYYEFLLFQNYIYVIEWFDVISLDGIGPTLHRVDGMAGGSAQELWVHLEKSLRMTEGEKCS